VQIVLKDQLKAPIIAELNRQFFDYSFFGVTT